MSYSEIREFVATDETKEECFDLGAADLWSLMSQFLTSTVAERRIARVESVNSIADLLVKYTPETLAEAVAAIATLRDATTFHQGDILVNTDGVRITIITSDSATGNKEGVTSSGKCYTVINVYEWTKTGETNTNLIEALDDVDAGT